MAVDFKALNRNQQGALVAGALALILSLFDSYVTVDVKGVGGLGSVAATNAWDSWATIGMLLVLAATVLVALKAFSPSTLPDGVPWALITAAAAGLGTLLLILRAFTYDDGGIADVGPGWSGWLLFIAALALTVFSLLSFRESGEKMPDFKGEAPPAPLA
jgi:hypothetical protein